MVTSRKLKPKYWILCEWKTECSYFWNVKNLSILWVKLDIKEIWQLSGVNKWKLKEIMKKVDYTNADLKNTKSKVFVVLDIDGYDRESYSQENISFIKNTLENDNVMVLFSNKDFELWILLHFELFNKASGGYLKEIRKYNKSYKKWGDKVNWVFFQDIIKRLLDNAIKNAKSLGMSYNGSDDLKDRIPYTEIYKIFENVS